MTALSKAQTQVTTGKRLTAASDDPAAAAQIMSSNSSLARTRAVSNQRPACLEPGESIEDSTLSQLGDLL